MKGLLEAQVHAKKGRQEGHGREHGVWHSWLQTLTLMQSRNGNFAPGFRRQWMGIMGSTRDSLPGLWTSPRVGCVSSEVIKQGQKS